MTMDKPVCYFLYRSQSDLSSSALRELLAQARKTNRRLGLTGYLHYEDGVFYQWLEGEPGAHAEVRAKILADPRHHNIEVLDQGVLDQRRFNRFDMGFSEKSEVSLFDFLAERAVGPNDARGFSEVIGAFLDGAAAATA